jgi:hypothetical protein
VTIGRDQLRVPVALEREGVEGEGQPSPRLASQQLALSIPDPSEQHRPAVKVEHPTAERP